jgi:GC-rich sequence DNA-binding factor
LRASRATRQNQIEAADRDLVACDTQETELRAEVTMVEAKKEWMEEFRGWVEMLGGFLEEKVGRCELIHISRHIANLQIRLNRIRCRYCRRSKRT